MERSWQREGEIRDGKEKECVEGGWKEAGGIKVENFTC